MSANPASSGPRLLRVVSRWEIVALSVNDVIGSGVYLILPVAAAQLLGAASVWAILAAGFAVLLIVLCFAEAGSLFDRLAPSFQNAAPKDSWPKFCSALSGTLKSLTRVRQDGGFTVRGTAFFRQVLVRSSRLCAPSSDVMAGQ